MANAGQLFPRCGLCHATSFALFICVCAFIILMQTYEPMWFHVNYLTDNTDQSRSISSLQPCNCSRRHETLAVVLAHSTCSDHATSRGPNQNVVSYAYFGNTSSLYFQGIELTAKAVAQSYPGWIMRLYHNVNMSVDSEAQRLCAHWCQHHHLDLCDVRDLPDPLHDQSRVCGTIWRFFVLGDPLVDKFMMRDIDSPITDREVAAVNEWLATNVTFHIMRDHPYHMVHILAGMWGGRNCNLKLTEGLRGQLINDGNCNGPDSKYRGLDQDLLKIIVWPTAVNDSISHDSFTCKSFPNTRPFPTRLNDTSTWVGHSYQWKGIRKIQFKCPIECRPKDHVDWEYC